MIQNGNSKRNGNGNGHGPSLSVALPLQALVSCCVRSQLFPFPATVDVESRLLFLHLCLLHQCQPVDFLGLWEKRNEMNWAERHLAQTGCCSDCITFKLQLCEERQFQKFSKKIKQVCAWRSVHKLKDTLYHLQRFPRLFSIINSWNYLASCCKRFSPNSREHILTNP